MAVQVDYRIVPSDQFTVYNPDTKSNKTITYFTLLSKIRGDLNIQGIPTDIITGSGNVNTVAKFDGEKSITNSQIYDSGTYIGISNLAPEHKLDIDGGVFADYFQLDTTYTDGNIAGKLSWNPDRETAELGLNGTVSLILGQDNLWYVKNQTGTAIPKGRAVMAVGALGASSRILVAPMVADGSVSSKYLIGVTIEEIANGDDGFVLAQGKLRGINTSGYTQGTVLYCDPDNAGQFTDVEPTAPELKLPIAFTVDSKNNGTLAIRVTAGTTISEANDVQITSIASNDFLVYNSTSGAFENEFVGIFKTVAVSGQDNVVADSYTDTLTLVEGSSITITTNGDTDSITISSADTLDSVTGRGATTTNSITVGGLTATSSLNSVDVLRIGNTESNSGSIQGFTHLAINHFGGGTYPSTRITAYQDGLSGWNGGMYFSTRELNTDSAPIERMRITSAGNVGIGTTSPSTKLYVAGDALIEDAATFNTSVKLGGNLLTDVQEFTHTEGSESDIAEESYIILNKFGTGNGNGFLYLPSVSSFSTYTPTYRLLAASSIDATHWVRILPSSSDTGVYINGANYIDLNTSYSVISLVLADGQWYVIDSK